MHEHDQNPAENPGPNSNLDRCGIVCDEPGVVLGAVEAQDADRVQDPVEAQDAAGQAERAVEAQKARLVEAAGEDPNSAWDRGGTERMFFEHASDRRILGSVEIDNTGGAVTQARLELLAPVEVLERVIQLVTGDLSDILGPPAAFERDRNAARAAAEAPSMPPTRDPGPEDLFEEPDGLPPEVMAVEPEPSLSRCDCRAI